YLGLGALGAPIFTTPFGPTAGYLLGFIAVPWVIGRFRSPAHGILAASLTIYAFGALWLSIWLQVSPMTAVLLGVAPYLPGDILKAVAAYGLINYARPQADALD
ncbi:MAG: biotin transporter BioY, partial [Candidatus Hydrogenedentes bacterium]|nr:biotin transporter BioY [Candidatus Hydrogenedentota bacterium]